MNFPSSYSDESPIVAFIIAATISGLVLGALTVWRPSVGMLWLGIVEVVFPVA
ncbi:MAG TPA: hypothetical protein VIT91_09715 [Chthoniobacterales bacterium]